MSEPPSAIDRSGQAAIAVRHALAAGDAVAALAGLPGLDPPHRIEVLLGAAIRDCAEDHAAVRAWLASDMPWLCACLARRPDTRLDDAAVGLIVRRRAPEHWRAAGPDAAVATPDEVAAALLAGAGGLKLLARFGDRLLHPAVLEYYREGTIHALGVRPLLILAGSRVA